MNNIWEEIPQSEKKIITISCFKWIKYNIPIINKDLNPNDFDISIEELEPDEEGMIEI